MSLPLILSVTGLFVCLVLFFYFRGYVDKKTSVERLLAEYRTEVYRLIAEIDAVTDRNLRLVEDSVKTLKQLLEDTDRRIGVYTRELERSRKAEAMYTSLGRGIRVALDSERPSAPKEPPSLPVTPVPQETSSPMEPSSPLETPSSQETPETASAKERRAKRTGGKPPRRDASSNRDSVSGDAVPGQGVSSKRKLKVRIAEMSARGLSPQEIASRLNLSLTEVDLALNLLQRPGN
jgi:hypothetical protein